MKHGVNRKPYPLHDLLAVVVTNTTTLDEIKTLCEEAAADDAWLILVYHRSSPEAKLDSEVTPQSFQATLDYLVAAGHDVRPMGEILGIWQPTPIVDPPAPDIVTGKSFDPPDAVTSAVADDPLPGAGPRDGCDARKVGGGYGCLLLLGLGLAAVRLHQRRRRLGNRQ